MRQRQRVAGLRAVDVGLNTGGRGNVDCLARRGREAFRLACGLAQTAACKALSRVVNGAHRIVPADAVDARFVLARSEAGDVIRVAFAVDAGRGAGCDVPRSDAAVGATRPQRWSAFGRFRGRGGGCDVSLVAAHDSDGLVVALDEVVEVAFQVHAYNKPVASSVRPHHTDLLIGDADAFTARTPGLQNLAGLGIPDFYCLVCARCCEVSGILRPRNRKDTACMLTLADLLQRFARLAVVEPYLLIGAYADQNRAIRAELRTVDEFVVVASQAGVVLERGAVKECERGVVAACCCAEGSLLADRNAVYLGAVAGYFSY